MVSGRLSGFIVNELPKNIVFLVWLGINIFLFAFFYQKYNDTLVYHYSFILLGPALPLARAPAAVLNFNCLLVLLPICRNLLSLSRRACMCCPRRIRRILDKNIKFHRMCAYMIVLMTLIHYFAHSFNVEYMATAHDIVISPTDTPAVRQLKLLKQHLTAIGNLPNQTYLNPIRNKVWPVGAVFLLTGGWTGVIITLSLFFMVTSSVEFIRRSYFEVFWYTHHLFIVFYSFLVIHGIGMQVRSQNNTLQHNPIICAQVPPSAWNTNPNCSTTPTFVGSQPMTWKWVIGGMVIYVIERIIRLVRYSQPVKILKVIKHPSKVIEIQMRKKGFFAEVGQYVFVMCPDLSNLEWHPFTLTSAPEEDYFSVHVRIVGDWTRGLNAVVGADSADGNEVLPSWKMPRIAIDGPFGTASEDVFTYPVAVCVGSGIGVTPFASLLKSVWYKNLDPEKELVLKKVYFFWICPETHAFEWFGDMLSHLEQQLSEIGRQDLIEYNIYLTRGWDAKQAKAIAAHEEDERDVITGLEQKTHFGRPNWDELFRNIGQTHPNTHIGVFFCGVAALSHQLHKMSNKHSGNGVFFHYNKENF
uniref:Predicted NADPH oxidase 2 n=1 Tax=Phallusia mammillata TaxID=59560 RepID=A0A6F9DA58_9ASCI|nr:predicted NADPH oxidase 2 [Phallusia mammillata]